MPQGFMGFPTGMPGGQGQQPSAIPSYNAMPPMQPSQQPQPPMPMPQGGQQMNPLMALLMRALMGQQQQGQGPGMPPVPGQPPPGMMPQGPPPQGGPGGGNMMMNSQGASLAPILQQLMMQRQQGGGQQGPMSPQMQQILQAIMSQRRG